jgi:hypothetical protein
MQGKNLRLALLLSLSLILGVAILYIFSPLIRMVLFSILGRTILKTSESGGIGAVAGGVSQSLVNALALLASLYVLILVAILIKRGPKDRRSRQ